MADNTDGVGQTPKIAFFTKISTSELHERELKSSENEVQPILELHQVDKPKSLA